MSFNRAVLLVLAVLLMPGLALAQTQTRATFNVSKVFTDGNPSEITVTLSCTNGLPLEQSQQISAGDPVEFVLVEFTNGLPECVVTESGAPGYSASFAASGASNPVSDNTDPAGCRYSGVADGHDNTCVVTNSPDPIAVSITKDWVVNDESLGDVDDSYTITLSCNGPIVGVQEDDGSWVRVFSDSGENTHTAQVVPTWPDTDCSVNETVFDSAVEVNDGCGSFSLEPADPAFSCTITNTVFFEGIPTLNQYGLAVLALVMLGVGFVGFRRFA